LEQFIETDSFDAPKTVPPAQRKKEPDSVTLDAFMSTSMFEADKVKYTNEDVTVMPDAAAGAPSDDDIFDVTGVHNRDAVDGGETVVIDPSATDDEDETSLPDQKPGKEDDEGSEDPTELK
jgi:hypothetical protein